MPLAIHAFGQAARRGLAHRVPAPDRLLADVETWLRTEYADVVRSTTVDRTELAGEADGDQRRTATLRVELHPAAASLTICAEDGGRLTLDAHTDAVGPGYERFCRRAVERLGSELAIDWFAAPADGDDARPLETPDRTSVERGHLVWLATTLTAIHDARRHGVRTWHVGTPADVRFAVDAALATPLGPRDDAWLNRAITDPRVAIDILPWWADATDARYLLNRALCLMWTDVRWRRPVDDDESTVIDEVLRLLRRAYPLDPALPYPWREWHELLEVRGADEPMRDMVLSRAVEASGDGPTDPIGYRRRPVTLIHEGWAVDIPGSFSSQRTTDEWSGRDGGRTITIAAIPTGTDAGPMTPRAFLDLVAADLGEDALSHQDGDVLGRARLTTDGSSGVGIGVLEGFSAVHGSGAAVRIAFHDPADWQWALDTWRGLAHFEEGSGTHARV